jgi:hypothetical protein
LLPLDLRRSILSPRRWLITPLYVPEEILKFHVELEGTSGIAASAHDLRNGLHLLAAKRFGLFHKGGHGVPIPATR